MSRRALFTVIHGSGRPTDHSPQVCQIGTMIRSSALGVAANMKKDATPPNVPDNAAWRAYRRSIRVVRLVPVRVRRTA